MLAGPREFALLNGGKAAIEENGMKRLFRILSAAGLVHGTGSGRAAGGSAAAAAAQGGYAGGDRGGQGNPDHEACQRDVCQAAVPNIVEKTKETLVQTNLNYQKDLNEVAVIVAQKPGRPPERNRRRHGQDLRQRVHRAGAEGSGDVLQVAARPEVADDRAQGNPDEHVLYEPVGAELLPRSSTASSAPRCASAARRYEGT